MKKFRKQSNAKQELNKLFDKIMHNDKHGVCCICGKPYHDYGNNAMPLVKGRCCSECNNKYVNSLRIQLLLQKGIHYSTIKEPVATVATVKDIIAENYLRK